MFKASEVQSAGIRGTYVSRPYGGIGLGYRMPCGTIVKSGGNGFYSPVDAESFTADDGDGYMDAVRSLGA